VTIEKLLTVSGLTIVVVLIATLGSCTMHANYKAAELAKLKVDANTIKCIISAGNDTGVSCALAAKN
jgi:hypothetical protein